ncbi:MAG: hypothetical protein KGQ42_00505 [Alphaproteobacteria bacterium]|nr:hypothetical protein [Alphaproteobacteria bacterium]MDE2041936.1 hypothetical protein [Alphaproteobacteria bacterium]MDE2341201.1 hypothetical protein [Alphaproteobacteria bacterium]
MLYILSWYRIQVQAREIAALTGHPIYDSQIIAAAIDAGCTLLWSEDMQHRHQVSTAQGNVVIRNPFMDDVAHDG